MNNIDKLSLKKIDIYGNVLGKFSTFTITQEYINETSEVLEVIYTFPISSTATVTGFTAKIGDKVIKGKVKEKDEARKDYEKAMVKGDSAYLMTNEESNIFQMNIGKIDVGETVNIQLEYVENFEILDSNIRMIVPTLVAPRYGSAVTEKLQYEKFEVEYRGNLTIQFDEDLKLKDITSPSHSIKQNGNRITSKNLKLDKDFVLDIKLEIQPKSMGYSSKLPNGNEVVYLTFLPNIKLETKTEPKNYLFVMDISGSMQGFKIEQNKEAVIKCLKQLQPGDKFNIITFNTQVEVLSDELLEYNTSNYEKAKHYVKQLEANGGTHLDSAVKKALESFGDSNIVFLFTDGDVGNEDVVAGYVRKNIKKSNLFVFGIDSAVNKNGLELIAEAGNGKVEFIVRDEDIKDIIIRQFARVSSANLFNVKLLTGDNKVINTIMKQKSIFNQEFFDVLVEVPEVTDNFVLQLKTENETYELPLYCRDIMSVKSLDKVYAIEQIKHIEKYINRSYGEKNDGYKEQIVKLAIEYQVSSKYTAFIAVYNRKEKVNDIPVLQETILEVPSGWVMYNCDVMSFAAQGPRGCPGPSGSVGTPGNMNLSFGSMNVSTTGNVRCAKSSNTTNAFFASTYSPTSTIGHQLIATHPMSIGSTGYYVTSEPMVKGKAEKSFIQKVKDRILELVKLCEAKILNGTPYEEDWKSLIELISTFKEQFLSMENQLKKFKNTWQLLNPYMKA